MFVPPLLKKSYMLDELGRCLEVTPVERSNEAGTLLLRGLHTASKYAQFFHNCFDLLGRARRGSRWRVVFLSFLFSWSCPAAKHAATRAAVKTTKFEKQRLSNLHHKDCATARNYQEVEGRSASFRGGD